MAIVINGQTGIDAGHLPISNAGNTEIEGTLTGANVTVASITANSVITQGQNVSPFSGFKNYIINGNFDVWQYETSQTSSGYGSDDRWRNANNGSTKTHSRVACTDAERALFNASYFSRTVVTSVAGDSNYVDKYQHIEDVTRLSGKTVTVSFWARSDSSKKLSFNVFQYLGVGGSPHWFGNAITVNLTSTWTKFSATLTYASVVGKTLGNNNASGISFQFDAGATATSSWFPGSTVGQQSGTFDIAQVQLEEGSVATPFEQRPYGLELSLCQRYFEMITLPPGFYTGIHINSDGGTYYSYFSFMPKRITPTVTSNYNAANMYYGSADMNGTVYLSYDYGATFVGLANAGNTAFVRAGNASSFASGVGFVRIYNSNLNVSISSEL